VDIWTITGLLVAIIFFILGLVGTIIPMLPSAPLIWVGMLAYGLIAGFEDLSLAFFLWQGLLVLLVLLVDYITTALGTHYFGGTRAGFWGAVLGLLVGVIFFNLPGLLLGTFLGAVAGELIASPDIKKALISGIGAVIGFLGGIPFKLLLEIIMIAWFFIVII